MSNILKEKELYFIGIKGVGMTMLAQFLAAKGVNISGSDIKESFLTDKVLKDSKIKVFSPFKVSNVKNVKAKTVIYSSAYNELNNEEFAYIKNNRKDIRLLSYAEALAELFNSHKGIAVCGSHGKTTTTAFLGYVLNESACKANVLVGSRVPQFKGSSLVSKSKHFIIEADEYQNKLKYFFPYGVVLNNIDYDHPDFFKDKNAYVKVFKDFVKKIPENGFLVINNSDEELRKIKKGLKCSVITYDLVDDLSISNNRETVNYLAYDLKTKNSKQYFKVNNLGEFSIGLIGRHNVLNALAVIATSVEMKVPIKKIKENIKKFKGTERRSQVLGSYKKALIIDDYAHHPTEIKTTLDGLRSLYKNKNIITVFHPHTFTRTKALFSDFVKSFSDANELIVLDIYGSAREKQGGTSSLKLSKEIIKFNRVNKIQQKVCQIKTIEEAAKYLKKKLNEDDVLVLMGAGDVFRVAKHILK